MTNRDYRKFFTYPETAAFMAALLDAKPCDCILEPSAGSGNLIRAVLKHSGFDVSIHAVELKDEWYEQLKEISSAVYLEDFLKVTFKILFDGAIANPPFGNGVDLMAHFEKIRGAVKGGGKIVMIVPIDFHPKVKHTVHPLNNWSINSDGTTTEIKIIEFLN